MATVRWSVNARADLRNIRTYLDRISPEFSKAFTLRITSAVTQLKDFPQMGRVVPEFDMEVFRELIFQNYRVVYRLERDSIGVVGIVHASMDLTSRLAPRVWDVT